MASNEDVPFAVEKSREFGRYQIAKKNIIRGELILTEAPLVVFPRIGEISEDGDVAICIHCYRVVKNEEAFPCKLCQWPFCNTDCLKNHFKNPECVVLSENNICWSHDHSRLIFLLRVILLRETDPNKWQQVMELTSTFSTSDPDRETLINESTSEGVAFLEKCHLNVSQNEVNTLIKIFHLNSFSFGNMDVLQNNPMSGEPLYDVIYHQTSLFANSCSPNVKFEQADGFSIAVTSKIDIKAGEMLTISYANDYLLKSTKERRAYFLKQHGFICQCLRCMDPTELGTFYSSLKCPCCRDGWMSPPTSQLSVQFKCNTCPHFTTLGLAGRKERKFSKTMSQILQKEEICVELLERLICKATSNYGLHPNHNLVVRATAEWLTLVDLNILLGSTPSAQVLYTTIVKRAEKLKEIYHIFGVYEQRIMVTLEAIVATAEARFKFKSTKDLPALNDGDTFEKTQAKLKEISLHLAECSVPERFAALGVNEKL